MSKSGRLRWGSFLRFWFNSVRLLLVGVVFFPSLPFMGVMLFPSFALGNASGEGSTPLAPFSPFSVPLSLSLISSPSSSFPLFCHLSFSLFPFLPHKLLPSLFFFSSFPHLPFPSLSSLPSSSALSFHFPSFFASFFCSFLFPFFFSFHSLFLLCLLFFFFF